MFLFQESRLKTEEANALEEIEVAQKAAKTKVAKETDNEVNQHTI